MGDPTDNCLSIIVTRDGGGNTWTKIPCDSCLKPKKELGLPRNNSNIALYGNRVWIATGE
ncbi:MAG: hypothetical protein R2793_10075 [Flavobacteriaceae bacterium]